VHAVAVGGNVVRENLNFASGKWTNLLSIERSKAFGFGGKVSLSRDGQWVVYSSLDQTVNDIMLVENFR
jgi:hypothetical protein